MPDSENHMRQLDDVFKTQLHDIQTNMEAMRREVNGELRSVNTQLASIEKAHALGIGGIGERFAKVEAQTEQNKADIARQAENQQWAWRAIVTTAIGTAAAVVSRFFHIGP